MQTGPCFRRSPPPALGERHRSGASGRGRPCVGVDRGLLAGRRLGLGGRGLVGLDGHRRLRPRGRRDAREGNDEAGEQGTSSAAWRWKPFLPILVPTTFLLRPRLTMPRPPSGLSPDARLRHELVALLRGGQAHTGLRALDGVPTDRVNDRVAGFPHSLWDLLEHLRFTQADILEYAAAPDYRDKTWPADYWPDADAGSGDWDAARDGFRADLDALAALAETADLTAELPHAPGYTALRQILLAADPQRAPPRPSRRAPTPARAVAPRASAFSLSHRYHPLLLSPHAGCGTS